MRDQRNGRQAPPQVNVLDIEEHTYPSFNAEVSEPMQGTRMLTVQIVDTPNRKVIKHHFPMDVGPAQDLGNKLSAPSIQVATQLPEN